MTHQLGSNAFGIGIDAKSRPDLGLCWVKQGTPEIFIEKTLWGESLSAWNKAGVGKGTTVGKALELEMTRMQLFATLQRVIIRQSDIGKYLHALFPLNIKDDTVLLRLFYDGTVHQEDFSRRKVSSCSPERISMAGCELSGSSFAELVLYVMGNHTAKEGDILLHLDEWLTERSSRDVAMFYFDVEGESDFQASGNFTNPPWLYNDIHLYIGDGGIASNGEKKLIATTLLALLADAQERMLGDDDLSRALPFLFPVEEEGLNKAICGLNRYNEGDDYFTTFLGYEVPKTAYLKMVNHVLLNYPRLVHDPRDYLSKWISAEYSLAF